MFHLYDKDTHCSSSVLFTVRVDKRMEILCTWIFMYLICSLWRSISSLNIEDYKDALLMCVRFGFQIFEAAYY